MSQNLKLASYENVSNERFKPILIVTNSVQPQIKDRPLSCPKYKKISKGAREKLLKLVDSGYPIITVSLGERRHLRIWG